MSILSRRVARLEASLAPRSRSFTLFQSPGEDMDARIDGMIRAGEATDRDLFVIIRWIEADREIREDQHSPRSLD